MSAKPVLYILCLINLCCINMMLTLHVTGVRHLCGPGEFTCLETGQCINAKYVCDNYTNCVDSSDESQQLCCEYSSSWLTILIISLPYLCSFMSLSQRTAVWTNVKLFHVGILQ